MDPVSLGLAFAQFAPSIMRFFGLGEKPAAVAQQVVDIAQSVTGAGTPEDALTLLHGDPKLAHDFQMAVLQANTELEKAALAARTKQLAETNATMRVESAADDGYVRRWRPTFGYAIAATWTAQMGACVWAILKAPESAGEIISAFGSLAPMWMVALSVLGVGIAKRSQDKQVRAGQQPATLGAALANRLLGK